MIYTLVFFLLVPALIVGFFRFEAAYRAWKNEQMREILKGPFPSRDCNLYVPGVTMREAASALATMGKAGPWVCDLLSEQCSHTQTNEDGYEMVLPVEEIH